MGPTTFEEMDIPQPPAPRSFRFPFRRKWKKRESKGKGKMMPDPADPVPLVEDGAYTASDYGRMSDRSLFLYAGGPEPGPEPELELEPDAVFHLVTLPDGCTLRVDASYLPMRPNALDAAGGRHCRCEDDAQAVVAAYLLQWPAWAAAHLAHVGWTRPAADDAAARLLDGWGLGARRLAPATGPGLSPATVAAARAALAGGVAGVERRRRRWEEALSTEGNVSPVSSSLVEDQEGPPRKAVKFRRSPWAWVRRRFLAKLDEK